ncbi:sulfite oxidase heme-binding subunit YedZ [Acuticoccus kandeliae]|uniref:sulfite oxidase heme-binding subunit YedZ n=1 Tax=Acuticoccus kandeliae TaxID=2073160 RepID=UPI000D3EBE59|nr:protein-methionine-sulfoxide reductase heme-binding subunit MsrQ [Acuticoccus kandeliae]
MPIATYLPWNDRRGRFSWLRTVAFAAAVVPSVFIVSALITGRYAAEPYGEATLLTGEWTLYFLIASLAVTPLRRLLGWARLVGIRRLLGLTAFAYLVGHFGLYIVDQGFDLAMVASEIALRIYLTIGFVALVGLSVLAATSFDSAIRRLGTRWRRIHQAVYVLTPLGLLHYFMQSKADVSPAVLLSGIFIGLMLYRALDGVRARHGAAAAVLVVVPLAGVGAALVEYAWYALGTNLPAWQILLSNVDFSYQIRPMWFAMLILALPLPVLLVQEILRRAGPGAPTGRPARVRG